MGQLFSVIGFVFFASVIFCWLLTSTWMSNPLVAMALFLAGILGIGWWAFSAVELSSQSRQ